MLSYKNIQDIVLNLLDQTGDTNHTLTLVKNAINIAHQKRLMEEQWNFMLYPNPVSLTFKTGVRNYTLHPLMGMMAYFINSTAKQDMKETPARARLKALERQDRYHYEFVNMSPVKLPSSQGKLTVTGKSYLSYVDINGNFVNEEVDNTQTTYSVDTVIGVSNMDLTATLSIADLAGNNILSLAVGEVGKQYPQIRLFDDGVGTETGTYLFYRLPRTLVNDNDVPDIPFPFSNVCVYDTLLEIASYNDDKNPPPYWLVQQEKWDLHMRQAFQEGEGVQSEARTYQYSDGYEG